MFSNCNFIGWRMRAFPETPGVGTNVLLRWIEIVGGTPDLGTGAIISGTMTLCSGVERGLVHTCEAKSVLRQHAEIQAGDMIIEFQPDVNLARESLEFGLGGNWYEQKEVGEALTRNWDTWMGDMPMERTVVLRMKS